MTAAETLIVIRVAVALVGLLFLLLIGGVLTVKMCRGTIDLSGLIREGKDGDASMARFQLLVFTLVVALCLFYVTVGCDGSECRLPEVPDGILTLLGISASSYAVGKGLQVHRETKLEELKKQGD